jgi:hypothetical protein
MDQFRDNNKILYFFTKYFIIVLFILNTLFLLKIFYSIIMTNKTMADYHKSLVNSIKKMNTHKNPKGPGDDGSTLYTAAENSTNSDRPFRERRN